MGPDGHLSNKMKTKLLILALALTSCSNEINKREQMRITLNDLAVIGHSYPSLVSNLVAGISVEETLGQLSGFGRLSVRAADTNFYFLQRGKFNYYLAIDAGATYSTVIACSAKPRDYYLKNFGQTNVWAIETPAAAYAIYRSRFPPVPGCVFDSTKRSIAYPPGAIERLRLLCPEALEELKEIGYATSAEIVQHL
jgi:hypothetical protein